MRLTGEVTKALRGGFAQSPIARVVPLESATSAPDLYASAMSAGKIVIQLGPEALGNEASP